MSCGPAVPGVWCAGEPMKLGRARIGAWGYVPRAGASCTRLDTMIEAFDAWAIPIVRAHAWSTRGRVVTGVRMRKIRRDTYKLCAEVWDETDIGNDVCGLTQPETASLTSAGGECRPNRSKRPTIPMNDGGLSGLALGETERMGELGRCELRAGAAAPLTGGIAQNTEN